VRMKPIDFFSSYISPLLLSISYSEPSVRVSCLLFFASRCFKKLRANPQQEQLLCGAFAGPRARPSPDWDRVWNGAVDSVCRLYPWSGTVESVIELHWPAVVIHGIFHHCLGPGFSTNQSGPRIRRARGLPLYSRPR
jgi:hypothetical protein